MVLSYLAMMHFNLFEWLTRRRVNLTPKVEVEFKCTACNYHFKRKLRRLYIDLNTLDQRQLLNKPQKRSEFVVPERITCPKCKAVDKFRPAKSTYHLLATVPLIASDYLPNPHNPIQCIRFALPDGQAMHPLDALNLYAQQVAQHSDRIDLRLEYANTLRMLGYHTEAESQYQTILAQDPTQPNALINLAFFHDRRQNKEAAANYLNRLIEAAPQSQHPDHDIFAEAAQQILDGVIKMGEIELTAPVLFEIKGR